MGWSPRGENQLENRRKELRRVAETQAEAQEKTALAQIEYWSVQEQRQLLATGLESTEARAFLDRRPKLEALMPALQLVDIERKANQNRAGTSINHSHAQGPVAFILAQNIRRRQLNKGQQAMAVALFRRCQEIQIQSPPLGFLPLHTQHMSMAD